MGIGEDREHRASVPWGQAAQSSLANFEVPNLLYSIGRASEEAKRYDPFKGDKRIGQTAATLMNTPILGGPLLAAGIDEGARGSYVGMPGGRGLQGRMPELPFPEPEPVGTSKLIGHNQPPEPEIQPGKQSNETYLDPLGFYSAVQKGADNLPIGKKGWTKDQILSGLKKQPNVKDEEIAWMDLRNKLGEQKTWTKDQLNELVDKQRVTPRKTVLEEGEGMTDDELRDHAADSYYEDTRNFTIKPDHEVVHQRTGELSVEHDPNEEFPSPSWAPHKQGEWVVVDDERAADDPQGAARGEHILGRYDTEDEAQAALDEHAQEWANEIGAKSVYDSEGDRIKEGSEVYRDRDEKNLLDEARQEYVDQRMEDFDPDEYRDAIGEDRGAKHLQHLGNRPGGEEAGEDYRENVYTVPQDILKRQGQKPFNSSHYEEVARSENGPVVSHALLHDYVDARTGRPVTYLTEGQSDWQKAQTRSGVAAPAERVRALEQAYGEASRQFKELHDPLYVNRPLLGEYTLRDMNDADLEAASTYHMIPSQQTQNELRSMRWRMNDRVDQINEMQKRNNQRREDPQTSAIVDAEIARLQREQEPNQRLYESELAKYPAMLPEDAKAYVARLKAAQLRQREAENSYNQARHGVPQGPFVNSKTAANDFLAKQLLIEAARANPGEGTTSYVSWPSPELITDRWGKGLQENYEKLFPGAMLKWAKEHDPNAKITNVDIGNYQGTGPAEATPKFTWDPGVAHTQHNPDYLPEGQGALPLEGGKHVPSQETLNPLTERQRTAIERRFEEPFVAGHGQATIMSRPTDIEYAPFHAHQNPYHSQRNSAQLSPISPYSHAIRNPGLVPGYRLVDERGNPVTSNTTAFRDRAHAERALAAAQKFFDENPRMTPEELAAHFDLTEQPAIEMTPAMRESIKKKGFPLFVTGAPIAPGVMLDKHYGDQGMAEGGMPHLAGLPDRPTEESIAGQLPPVPFNPILRHSGMDPSELQYVTPPASHEHEHYLSNPSPFLSHIPNESMEMVNALPGEKAAEVVAKGAMRAGDVFKALKDQGWRAIMNKSGHTELTHPTHPGRIALPMKPDAAIPTKKMHDIFDRAGLTESGTPKFPMDESPGVPYPEPIDWAHPFVGSRASSRSDNKSESAPTSIQETHEPPPLADATGEINERFKKVGEAGAEGAAEHWSGGRAGYVEGGMPGMPHPYSTDVLLQEPGMDPSELQYITPPAREEQSLTNPTPTQRIPNEDLSIANAIAPGVGGFGRTTAGMAKGAMKYRDVWNIMQKHGWVEVGYTGSHKQIVNPSRPELGRTSIKYNHPNDMMPVGTMRSVFAQGQLDPRGNPLPKEAPKAPAPESMPEYGPIDPSHVSLGGNRFYDPNNDLVINRHGPEPHEYTASPLDKAEPEDQQKALQWLEENTKRRGGRVRLTAYAA